MNLDTYIDDAVDIVLVQAQAMLIVDKILHSNLYILLFHGSSNLLDDNADMSNSGHTSPVDCCGDMTVPPQCL